MAKAVAQYPPATGFNARAVFLLGIVSAIQVADPLLSSMALVKASSELNFSASTMALAAGISTLALAATAIPGGVLADRYGRRLMLMIAVLVAGAGELITAASPDALMYLIGRIVAGAALGVVFGAAYGMLRNVAATKSLGPAMATFNILNGVVPVIALVLGGVVIGLNWRFAYLMLPILMIVSFFLIPVMLPKVARLPKEGKTDFLGMILVGLGIVGLLFGLSMASHGLGNPLFWAPIVIAVVAFVLFAIRENRSSSPVFPIKILTHPAFLGAVIMGIFWNMGSAASSQMLPNMWQYVTHVKLAELGAAQMPMAAAGILGSVIAGLALGRGSKPRTTAVIGYALMTVGFVYYFFLPTPASYLLFIPGMVVTGLGWMMNATSQGNLFITLAPEKYFGPVSSSKMAVGQFGYSLGLTGSTVLVSSLTLSGVEKLTKGAVSGEANWDAITEYMANPTATPANPALAAVNVVDIEHIYAQAFSTTMLVIGIVVALAGVVMYLVLRRKNVDVPTDVFLGLAPATQSD